VLMQLNSAGRSSLLVNNVVAHHGSYNIRINGGDGFAITTSIFHNTLDGAPYGININSYVTADIANNILSNNTSYGIYINPMGTDNAVTVTSNLFHDNSFNGEVGSSAIFGDPQYINAAGRDYHILSSSAAINSVPDAGVFADMDDNIRPSGRGTTPYDAGADEYSWSDFIFLPIIIHP
jgi:hypothetical protein